MSELTEKIKSIRTYKTLEQIDKMIDRIKEKNKEYNDVEDNFNMRGTSDQVAFDMLSTSIDKESIKKWNELTNDHRKEQKNRKKEINKLEKKADKKLKKVFKPVKMLETKVKMLTVQRDNLKKELERYTEKIEEIKNQILQAKTLEEKDKLRNELMSLNTKSIKVESKLARVVDDLAKAKYKLKMENDIIQGTMNYTLNVEGYINKQQGEKQAIEETIEEQKQVVENKKNQQGEKQEEPAKEPKEALDKQEEPAKEQKEAPEKQEKSAKEPKEALDKQEEPAKEQKEVTEKQEKVDNKISIAKENKITKVFKGIPSKIKNLFSRIRKSFKNARASMKQAMIEILQDFQNKLETENDTKEQPEWMNKAVEKGVKFPEEMKKSMDESKAKLSRDQEQDKSKIFRTRFADRELQKTINEVNLKLPDIDKFRESNEENEK